ncbi:NAD(P)-binding domain-containing protein [Emticicia sp. CRIBPO]|uniref:flavin-containing monooxygenase n=1 Tax=Emticicia sp. CRIBPO TaxID=2683258 RepID=UPI001412F10F|nr:NAD(P)-binding domain-containing protein [Emticicia sp. CRIBPO]NBA86619.1 NAD(P)-binding domain-containing protein [Emticicia sp. CRIBPO]
MIKVCIIGAGPSGITAAKTLKEAGIDFVCYEKGSDIGGVWRYNNDNGLSSAYKSLHINTNRNLMAYSDFPMPEHYAMFPHHEEIIRYFEDYVRHFDIRKFIRFKSAVARVSPEKDGRFEVKLEDGSSELFTHVIVANGHHWNPRYPEFEGKFEGEVMHSHYYREPDQIKNKDVLVVGIGNSAVDIACEAARQYSGKVVISTRSGAYITPNWIWSIPFDSLANPATARLPLWIQRKLLGLTLWLARGKQEDYGVPKPKRPLLSEHPTLSQDLLNLSGRGAVKFKPNIKKLEGRTVYFEDGTSQDFDILVYSTGYKITFPFLKHIPQFDVEETNDIRLYKKVIDPGFPGLFFIGLMQPLGAIMPLSEVQSKWIVSVLKGTTVLPTVAKMKEEIMRDKQKMSERYKSSARHTLQVDFHVYKNELEKMMK